MISSPASNTVCLPYSKVCQLQRQCRKVNDCLNRAWHATSARRIKHHSNRAWRLFGKIEAMVTLVPIASLEIQDDPEPTPVHYDSTGNVTEP